MASPGCSWPLCRPSSIIYLFLVVCCIKASAITGGMSENDLQRQRRASQEGSEDSGGDSGVHYTRHAHLLFLIIMMIGLKSTSLTVFKAVLGSVWLAVASNLGSGLAQLLPLCPRFPSKHGSSTSSYLWAAGEDGQECSQEKAQNGGEHLKQFD
ncbi:hypothetical protein C8R45DRAFT_933936 [Mycena sanguinolenta]|nr:hypothetical protein C8R45DRAFT_947756 [Mycena sanguinolenta]KAJ6478180.1 hypothetical protein C8R45DRAFT_933936 [Mycena sanguinolenta]